MLSASSLFHHFRRRCRSFSAIPRPQHQMNALEMQQRLLQKQQHGALLQVIKRIPRKVEELKQRVEFDEETTKAAGEQGGFFVSQLEIEKKQLSEAKSSFDDITSSLMEMGRGTGLKNVQRAMLNWFEDLQLEIASETMKVRSHVPGHDRGEYGPCLLLLPPDKFAMIVLDIVVGEILRFANRSVRVNMLTTLIGDAIETEVYSHKVKLGMSGIPKWQQDIAKKIIESSKMSGRKGKGLNVRLLKLIDEEKWANTIKVKLGAALVSMLINTAKNDNGEPAFKHFVRHTNYDKKLGYIEMDHEMFASLVPKPSDIHLPRYLPMLIPPKRWNNKRSIGCYWILKASLMRTYSTKQLQALSHANMEPILDGLNYLGNIPWTINKRMLEVVEEAWRRELLIGELPSQVNFPEPDKDTVLPRILEDLRANPPQPRDRERYSKRRRHSEPPRTKASTSTPSTTTEATSAEAATAEAAADESPELDLEHLAMIKYKQMVKRVKIKNAELHSLRCDLVLKLKIATMFQGDKIYYPYSLDFRGRAYPVPQNLNHLGSDLCRALLLFHEAKPLGKDGLNWLKVHLANLFGNNKISHDQRIAWVDANMDNIMDSNNNPLDGKQWWATAEDPFQALATCFELVAAVQSPDPTQYTCRLPIHQDGSCNGLQHYAALGRDKSGGTAVNLLPSDVPQDVYSKVLEIVLKRIEEDAAYIPPNNNNSSDDNSSNSSVDELASQTRAKFARLLTGVVNRKVIKQTVMTSVYGVTRTGARMQVQSKLEDKLFPVPNNNNNNNEAAAGGGSSAATGVASIPFSTSEMEKTLFDCSFYVANLTLSSLREMFTSAKLIMDWLSTCAQLLAFYGEAVTWMTPLGLPVIQPYRKLASHQVTTLLQQISLVYNDDDLPVANARQKSALPPNFVHSLDATHMLLSCLKMKDRNKIFASVHDSYWTHACDVGEMNEVIREAFIELYEKPILENFRESLVARFPHIDFPPLPHVGELDLKMVKESKYFFH